MKTLFDFRPYRFALHPVMSMDELHIQMLYAAAGLQTTQGKWPKSAVEIGSYTGASTAALVEALNHGLIDHLHVVETNVQPKLHQVLARAKRKAAVTLHTKPYWETTIGRTDLVFIDGDHKWGAIGDVARALTWNCPIICMHDSNASGPRFGVSCWGAVLGAQMLKDDRNRIWFEDKKDRPGMQTDRGFFVSTEPTVDHGPLTALVD